MYIEKANPALRDYLINRGLVDEYESKAEFREFCDLISVASPEKLSQVKQILIQEQIIKDDEAEDAELKEAREFIEKAYMHALDTLPKDDMHKECAAMCKLIYGEGMKPTSGGYLHIMGFLMGLNEGYNIADVFSKAEQEQKGANNG